MQDIIHLVFTNCLQLSTHRHLKAHLYLWLQEHVTVNMIIQLLHLLEFVPCYSLFMSCKPPWKYVANIDGTVIDMTANTFTAAKMHSNPCLNIVHTHTNTNNATLHTHKTNFLPIYTPTQTITMATIQKNRHRLFCC